MIEDFDWKRFAGAVLVLYVTRTVCNALWSLLFSPLSSIPGPRLAAVTDWWLEWHALRFRRCAAIHDAFQRFGPVVRIGPNKLALSNPDDVREIYRSHNFLKSNWYDGFTFGGMDNTFNTKDPVFHAKVRRWSAPAFRGDNLRGVAQEVKEVIGHFVERIKRESRGGKAIDALHLFRLLSLDVLGVAVFGTHFNQMESGKSHPFTEYLDDWLIDKGLANYLPSLVYRFLRFFPSIILRRIFAADPGMFALGSQLYDAKSKGGTDIVSTAKAYRDALTGSPPPRDEVVAEAAVFLGAGTDSTSVALTYVAYELALNEAFAREIRSEIGDIAIKDLDVDVLKDLPYLNALIKEVLRVHGPAPTFLERVVPSGGAFLGGRSLPAGTIVGAQSWTSHRDANLFPDPLRVDPERWVFKPSMNGQWIHRNDVRPEMQAAYFPFGQGVRACVGRPVAEMELLLVTAALVLNFKITIHADTTASSMEPLDIAVVGPAGMKCLLQFEKA
ncbi:cytochrome P450 [Auricularia subglabra TFB-10046 SS5]|nr:cytochrome P450 [Auricularia subglabra TFB-10046 SS5]